MNAKKKSTSSFHFFKTFLTQPRHIGSIFPSSQALAREMVRGIELKENEMILELGPGTGAITKEILSKFKNPDQYFAIEREESFVKLLQNKYSGFHFVHGNAQEASKIFSEKFAGKKVKAIISGLPFANFPQSLQKNIITAIDDITEEGAVFKTFQYLMAFWFLSSEDLRKQVGQIFGDYIDRKFVFWNITPAFVVTWKK